MSENLSDMMNCYDVRLYDTVDILEPCPYCGLERIIVEHHNGWHENPIDYTVEHLDEKAAVTAGCFDMYYAFNDLNFAIKKANTCKPSEVIDEDTWSEMLSNTRMILGYLKRENEKGL